MGAADHKPGPGDQQPRETMPAFRALRVYLELGPARTCAEVGRRLGHRSERQSQVWSARWDWQRRARQWDADLVRVADREHREAVAAAASRQAQEAQLHARASALVSAALVRKVAENPKALDGLDVETLARLSATMGRTHNRAVLTERLALGMSTSQDAEPLAREEAEAMAARLTPEELDARLAGVDAIVEGDELAPRRRRRELGDVGDASARCADDTLPGDASPTTS